MSTSVSQLSSPKGSAILGNAPDFGRDPLQFLTHCARNYGEIVPLRLAFTPAWLFSKPELVEYVMKERELFVKNTPAWRGFRSLVGEGLLTSGGDFWAKQRRLMQPVFHHQRIAAYAETMVAYTARLLETWQDGEIRDIHRDMTQLTLNVVTKTLFDRDMEGTEARDVAHALDVAMEWFASQRQWGFMLPYWVPTDVNRRYARALEEMDSSIYNLIRERRAGGENTGDLLSMLLQVQDETDGSRMSDRQLRDELATMVLAGHETTSNALAWTWMLLAQHPEVEARLLEEIQAVLGDRQPTAADLPLLPYTRAVIQESMRLYPPVFMQARSAARDCEVAGYRISANSIVLVSQWVMHRSDRYFEEPEAFRPERWANDFEKTLPKGVYFPFGEGPRICIGKGFALMEAALILASIARRFQLSLVPEHPIELLPAITLRPKYGIEVTVAKR